MNRLRFVEGMLQRGAGILLMAFLFVSAGKAQTVTLELNFPNYDVVFLSDFIDVSTQKLSFQTCS
jgi:hypothetical protein